ncbi:hypothetical protein FB451DRAFT_1403699 [Mycena latifolia]|nr:hypothetical protein FB451DRAFT_1403699 [Mycena latifolia]
MSSHDPQLIPLLPKPVVTSLLPPVRQANPSAQSKGYRLRVGVEEDTEQCGAVSESLGTIPSASTASTSTARKELVRHFMSLYILIIVESSLGVPVSQLLVNRSTRHVNHVFTGCHARRYGPRSHDESRFDYGTQSVNTQWADG